MSNLDHKSPKVYQDFMAGYHVLRKTEGRTLGSVSPDHIIEQTLMRSLKSAGGFHEEQNLKKSNVIFTSYLDHHVLKSVHQ